MSTRSPKFAKDELKIALYVYLQRPGDKISLDAPEIHWLSATLRQLPVHELEKRPSHSKFRSRKGVARRLRELEAIIEDRSDRTLKNYRAVWDQYGRDVEALEPDVRRLLEGKGFASLDRLVWKELRRRHNQWADFRAEGDVQQRENGLLRELRIYRGQAGVWVDTDVTRPVSGNEAGVAVSVHIGSITLTISRPATSSTTTQIQGARQAATRLRSGRLRTRDASDFLYS